jgi:hypothetical protein
MRRKKRERRHQDRERREVAERLLDELLLLVRVEQRVAVVEVLRVAAHHDRPGPVVAQEVARDLVGLQRADGEERGEQDREHRDRHLP